MSNNKITETPNIKEYFADINNLSADIVRETAMKMLEIMCNQTDNIIKKICNEDIGFHVTDIPTGMKKEITESPDDGFVFEDDKKEEIELKAITSGSIDITKLATTEAHRLFGQTLVVDIDPYNFAITNFGNLLTAFNKKCPKGIFELITEYETKLDERDAKIEYLTKETFKAKPKKASDEDDNPKDDSRYNKTDIMTLEDRIAELPEPIIEFPAWAQIKTIKHTKKYADKGTIIDPKLCRTPLSIEHLNFDEKINTTKTRQKHIINKLHITPDIATLLFCGVGIYSHDLSSNYLSLVLSLAKDGKLAYLIADASICYGTNYPINIVLVSEKFAMLHSLNTLFQLFGRAGRVGQSWVARAIIDSETAKRLISCAQGSNDGFDVEADNINLEASIIQKEEEIIAYNKTEKLLLEEEDEKIKMLVIKKKEESLLALALTKTSTQIAIDALRVRDAIARESIPIISVSSVGICSTKFIESDNIEKTTIVNNVVTTADNDNNWRRTSSKIHETNIKDTVDIKKEKIKKDDGKKDNGKKDDGGWRKVKTIPTGSIVHGTLLVATRDHITKNVSGSWRK
jgi:hypothetical protein